MGRTHPLEGIELGLAIRFGFFLLERLMNVPASDEVFMKEAIAEARRGWGNTHPNPLVGAVIVEAGEIVARGFHEKCGEPHAEVMALKNLGRAPGKGACMYVTLEPCSTKGRTGACTDALRAAGMSRVVVGAVDPNPQHAGAGLTRLSEAGVEVVSGVLSDECADLNLIFNHWIVERAPFMAVKVATTLDGHIATRAGHSQWITGEQARLDVMRWRRYFPAIAVGAGTVIADNPALTSRLPEREWCPVRFVFDRSLRTVQDELPKVYADAFAAKTIVVTLNSADAEKKERLKKQGASVWTLSEGEGASFLNAFKKRCLEENIEGVYFEAGATLMQSLLGEQFADYLFHYQAPKLIADQKAIHGFGGRTAFKIDEAICLENIKRSLFEPDQLLRGKLVYS